MSDTGGPNVDRYQAGITDSVGTGRDVRLYLVIGLAALLHVLINVTATGGGLRFTNSNPIEFAGSAVRFALSDPVLLIVLLAVGIDWITAGFQLPEARLKYWWIWLIGLTAWMAVSLVVGRLNTGEWIRWAYLNKGAGWFVLVGYFLAGLWLAQRGRHLAIPALATFIGVGWLVSAIGFAGFVVFVLFPELTSAQRFIRPQGLAANPNAFAISIAAIIAIQLPLMKARSIYRPWWFRIGLALMMIVLVYAGSRSAWVGMVAGLIVLLAFRQIPLREVLIAALLAGVINLLAVDLLIWSKKQIASNAEARGVEFIAEARGVKTHVATAPTTSPTTAPKPPRSVVRDPYYYLGRSNVLSDIGLNHRLSIAKRSIEDWRDRPVAGIGLGGFLWSHRGPDDPLRGIQIHATSLWLLIETGIVGLALFAAFFFAVIRALLWRHGKWEKDPVLIGIAAALIVVGAASIGTEILYQRYLWFLAGIGLAWPGLTGHTAVERDEPRSQANTQAG